MVTSGSVAGDSSIAQPAKQDATNIRAETFRSVLTP